MERFRGYFPLTDALKFDDDFFKNDSGLTLVCGGPCTDWTWTVKPGDHEKILKWLKIGYGETVFKIRSVLENGGEYPIYPNGINLRNFMVNNFGEPVVVQHGSQGLNAGIQSCAFGFPEVSYGHRISQENLKILKDKSPKSLDLMKKIDYQQGVHEPSLTINIRTDYGDRKANAYLSDASERNFNFDGVREHLESAVERIFGSLSSSVLVADIQVLGHSISASEFNDYLSCMNSTMNGIRRLRGDRKDKKLKLNVLVDCGGLNAYDDNDVSRLFIAIYSKAHVLGCNEAEAMRLSSVLGKKDKDPIQCAVNLVNAGVENVWMHTKEYQAFFTKDRIHPETYARYLAFSNLTAGLSLKRQEPVALDFLKEQITNRSYNFLKPVFSYILDDVYSGVIVPATDDKPISEIQAGDRAGIGLLHAMSKPSLNGK